VGWGALQVPFTDSEAEVLIRCMDTNDEGMVTINDFCDFARQTWNSLPSLRNSLDEALSRWQQSGAADDALPSPAVLATQRSRDSRLGKRPAKNSLL
jgi:hypothetical protein